MNHFRKAASAASCLFLGKTCHVGLDDGEVLASGANIFASTSAIILVGVVVVVLDRHGTRDKLD